MRLFLSSLSKKLVAVLKWTPALSLYHISHDKQQILSSFQDKIFGENIQYIYLTIIFLSIIFFVTVGLCGLITTVIFHQIFDSNPRSIFLLVCMAANIIYNLFLLVILKVDFLKKKVQELFWLLDIMSFIFFGIMVTMFNALCSPEAPVYDCVASAILQSSTIIFYFQNSFVVSVFFWITSISFSFIPYLMGSTRGFASSPVVSC